MNPGSGVTKGASERDEKRWESGSCRVAEAKAAERSREESKGKSMGWERVVMGEGGNEAAGGCGESMC